MTAENPWLTGGSNPEPTDAERDPFRALGFGFSEESPTNPVIAAEPAEAPVVAQAPASVSPAPWQSAPAPASASPAAPGTQPALAPTWQSAAAPAPQSLVAAAPPVAPLVAHPAAQPVAPPVVPPSAASSVAAPTSRRALREAERVEPAPRRTRAAVGAPPPRPTAASAPPRPVVSAAPQAPLGRRIAKKAFPPAVMLAVASLLVGTSVPANALFDPDAPPASIALSSMADAKVAETVDVEGQVIEAESVGDIATTAASRDAWTVTSYAEMLRLRYGSINYSYNAGGTGPVRWPFPYVAKITSAFGDRVAPCRGCSSYHRGVDFDAGYGAPVGAIADGIVTAVGRSSSFGYRVEIEHIINGQKVLSLYAHLIDNSSVLTVGSPVAVGDIVGALGNTGLSTGPHLHLEIHVDSVPVDPFAWLVANAG